MKIEKIKKVVEKNIYILNTMDCTISHFDIGCFLSAIYVEFHADEFELLSLYFNRNSYELFDVNFEDTEEVNIEFLEKIIKFSKVFKKEMDQ